jgi:thioredoxin-like negative regulator of GroEL
MEEAERALAERVNFGEVDCDRAPELAKALPVRNVPSVAYYREGKLIATLIGAGQDVKGCLERVLRGEPIGASVSTNTTDDTNLGQ